MKHKIDKTAQYPLCDKKSKTIFQILNECQQLAQKEYKKRYNNIGIVHWKLCWKYNLKRSGKRYEHAPECY